MGLKSQLTCKQLAGGYFGRAVVRGVSLSLEPGEFVGLLGANGGGKSTLLKLLLGLLKPMAGEIHLQEKPLAAWSAKERAGQIAYVPQQETSAFDFSVQDVVAMGRYPALERGRGLTSDDFAAIHEALEALALTSLAHRTLPTLSGGEQGRVRVARALAQKAPLLLLDEPTAHLDPAHGSRLMTLLRSLASEKGHGVLASLHDLNQAAHYCDRLLLLSEGKLTAQGTPEAVLTSENLRLAFGIEAHIETNPRTGKPMVLEYSALPQ